MKKMTLMVAAVALMVAMFAPAAFALDVDVTGDENNVDVTREGSDVRYNAVAQNIIGSIGDVTQDQFGQADAVSGDADADADGDDSEATATSEATAEVDQSQDFTVVQYNSALNDF